MKQLSTFVLLLLFSSAYAQPLTEKTSISIYEHHSSSKNGGAPFGNGANGDMSGYDFVGHKYVGSFDDHHFTPYSANHPLVEIIDLVEHNGPFSSTFNFGFTAGNSTIWASQGPPYIRGNGSTMYVKAPSSFSYENLTDVSAIVTEYNKGTPSLSVEAVEQNAVYLAKVRNTDEYVAMKITNLLNDNGATVTDVYFSFDYKYGTYNTSSISEIDRSEFNIVQNANSINIHTNNAIHTGSALSLYNVEGKRVYDGVLESSSRIRTEGLTNGVYMLMIGLPDNRSLTRKLIITN